MKSLSPDCHARLDRGFKHETLPLNLNYQCGSCGRYWTSKGRKTWAKDENNSYTRRCFSCSSMVVPKVLTESPQPVTGKRLSIKSMSPDCYAGSAKGFKQERYSFKLMYQCRTEGCGRFWTSKGRKTWTKDEDNSFARRCFSCSSMVVPKVLTGDPPQPQEEVCSDGIQARRATHHDGCWEHRSSLPNHKTHGQSIANHNIPSQSFDQSHADRTIFVNT